MDHEITALKVQKRNPNRVNVYLDGSYVFGLARVVAAWLQVGMMISDEKAASLQAQDAEEVAFLRALRFLGYRPRSQTEIRQKLEELGFDEPVVEKTIDRLLKSGLLGDDKFARLWVDNRSEFRPRSRRMLAFELRNKGVTDDVIEGSLVDVDDARLAFQAGERYARRYQQADWALFRTKLSSFLARRGFGYGTIQEVVPNLWKQLQQPDHPDLILENEGMDNG
jgi:regulatory protein